MSRLHNPGPGEILDRLSILALKVTYGKLAGKPIDHWQEETSALLTAVRKLYHDAGATGPTDSTLLELAAVNGALWQAEDELRAYREDGKPASDYGTWGPIVDCAFRIQQLNDRRAELVTLINTNAGLDRPGDKL